MNKMAIGLIAFACCVVAPPAALGGLAFLEVLSGNYDHLKKERILEILSKESTLYYSDGTTQLFRANILMSHGLHYFWTSHKHV